MSTFQNTSSRDSSYDKKKKKTRQFSARYYWLVADPICGASFFTVTVLKFSTAWTTLSSLAVAPKIPPSIFTDSQVLTCSEGSPAAVPSSRRTQSNPLSFASLIVVETQTSVVTPAMIKFLIPLFRSRSSKSVCANAPRPGLSITGSPRIG